MLLVVLSSSIANVHLNSLCPEAFNSLCALFQAPFSHPLFTARMDANRTSSDELPYPYRPRNLFRRHSIDASSFSSQPDPPLVSPRRIQRGHCASLTGVFDKKVPHRHTIKGRIALTRALLVWNWKDAVEQQGKDSAGNLDAVESTSLNDCRGREHSRLFYPTEDPFLVHGAHQDLVYKRPSDWLFHNHEDNIIHIRNFPCKSDIEWLGTLQPDWESIVLAIHGSYEINAARAGYAVWFEDGSVSTAKFLLQSAAYVPVFQCQRLRFQRMQANSSNRDSPRSPQGHKSHHRRISSAVLLPQECYYHDRLVLSSKRNFCKGLALE